MLPLDSLLDSVESLGNGSFLKSLPFQKTSFPDADLVAHSDMERLDQQHQALKTGHVDAKVRSKVLVGELDMYMPR